uniref:Protein CASP n=1 Tax=Anisakis simplex TaxID=6269 RepID=A0A0M3K2M0_ANISI
LEKQDEMLSILLSELDLCKSEISSLRGQINANNEIGISNDSNQQRNCSEQQISDEIIKLKEICRSAVDSAEQLRVRFDYYGIIGLKCFQSRNEELENELSATNAKVVVSAKPLSEQLGDGFEAFEKMRDELARNRFELDNLKRELHSKTCELDFAKDACASKQVHIERISESLRGEHSLMTSEISKLQQKLAEEKLNSEKLNAENASLQARLSVLSASEVDKDALIGDYARRLSEESAARKRDMSILTARLAVLVDQNSTLRASAITKNHSSCCADHAEQSPYFEGLLEDQRALIATLKEECSLLADKLRANRIQYKKQLKQLRRENDDLTKQLDRFIIGGQ